MSLLTSLDQVKEMWILLNKYKFYLNRKILYIKYLSGYEFGTLYRRIRTIDSSRSMFGVQSLCILLAGKSSLQENSNDNDILIWAKDRGGLWTVTPEVFKIFFTCLRQSFSYCYRKYSTKYRHQENCLWSTKYPTVLCNYNKIRHQSAEKVSKEIAMNLLEHLIVVRPSQYIFIGQG